jgi:predicted RNA-binding Zn-ribbon protein involved in translation (DUF1610 family)
VLVSTTTALALRCPKCGKIKYHSLSLFYFSAKKTLRLSCACGAPLLLVSTRDRKVFYFQVECLICEHKHLAEFFLREIWSGRVLSLVCSEADLEIGFIGPRDQVKKSIANQERSPQEMVDELGYTDYFANPEIMYEILDCLHKIAGEGNLSCQCGNQQVEVEIFAERIELRCSSCGSFGVIRAETRQDVKVMKKILEIVLKPGDVNMIGVRKEGRGGRRSKK